MAEADLQQILARLQAEQDKANAANEARYKELLQHIAGMQQSFGGTFDQAQSAAAGVGESAKRDLERRYTQLGGQAEQDLISRGLGNTTVRSSVQRGLAADQSLSRQGIDEQQALLRSGILQNRAAGESDIGRLMAGAIEGRTDAGPDLGLFAQLLQQAAASNTTPSQISVGPTSSTTGFSSRNMTSNGPGSGGTALTSGGGGASGGNKATVTAPGGVGYSTPVANATQEALLKQIQGSATQTLTPQGSVPRPTQSAYNSRTGRIHYAYA